MLANNHRAYEGRATSAPRGKAPCLLQSANFLNASRSKPWRSPYGKEGLKLATITYIFGAPGSGKTTYGAYLAKKYGKKGKRKVYANFPVKYATLIDDEDIGYYSFENSVILLDECGISYNNRDYKKGAMSDSNRLRYWKLARHYGVNIYVFSQGWDDVDKKIRTLATEYWLCKKSLIPCFTTYKKVYKKVDIDEQTHEPTDMYYISLFTAWKWLYRPKYYKLFDSFEAPELPNYEGDNREVVSNTRDDNNNSKRRVLDNIRNIWNNKIHRWRTRWKTMKDLKKLKKNMKKTLKDITEDL